MAYSKPVSLPQALAALAHCDAKIVAGGTDFFPALGRGKAPANMVGISSIPELRGVSSTDTTWSIGAATTWSEIVHEDLPPAFDGLKAAAREIGSIQIQNAGTIGGNICNASPAADGVPPLLTLGATVELRSVRGARLVGLADFITGVRRIDLRADELVYALHIPRISNAAKSQFLKLGSRKYMVISIAMVSVVILLDRGRRIEMARVAVGSCSAVAQRLVGLEVNLIGKCAAQLVEAPDIWSMHLGTLSPIEDVRGSAEYRLHAVAELCARAVQGAMTGTEESVDG